MGEKRRKEKENKKMVEKAYAAYSSENEPDKNLNTESEKVEVKQSVQKPLETEK